MAGSYSGSHKVGKPNPAMDMCFELQVCPDLLFGALAAAAAGAFYFIYTAVTMAARKKKRSSGVLRSKPKVETVFDLLQLGSLSSAVRFFCFWLPVSFISVCVLQLAFIELHRSSCEEKLCVSLNMCTCYSASTEL